MIRGPTHEAHTLPKDLQSYFTRWCVWLSPMTSSFIALLDSISIPKTVRETLSHLDWQDTMIKEMTTLDGNDTWELVNLLTRKKVIGCKWVFMVKVNPDGFVAQLKAHLVAATYRWPLHELDMKNIFLHGDPQEEVYMEQPPGFVSQGKSAMVCLRKSLYGLKQSPQAWFGRFSEVIQDFGLQKSSCNHSVFYRHSEVVMILLVVYVDVTRSKKGIVLSQRKYTLNLLEETRKSGCKPCSMPMDSNLQLMKEYNDSFEDPDIAYSMRVVSQGPLYQNYGHTSIECFTDADWARSKMDRRSTTGYYVFVEGNLISWKSKKQSSVAGRKIQI
ncbi:Cysteine-rich RLK (RECEPTOR-like protein kinase) 8 [Gossypium australe]|uniref:Cysteine-rich RLK (RECEPTOR-like protein kinase) 8 n=1 Tax=Gossypium australe TaxID=47621 RepID=A0A5B6WTX1_9ROSI|nr:Cysteine-rich RLK (RECEPTOR-like protein kinase) 8 [Gossypium australe]